MPDKNVVATTAMITGFCKERRMEDARVLFEKLQNRDCVSFNAMISGLLDGRGEYTLVYEDNEGDMILVGDVPWHMFVSTVKRLVVVSRARTQLGDSRSLQLVVVSRARTQLMLQ